MKTDSDLTRLHEYIKETLPWAHGHQHKALTKFVNAIFDKQTGCQAQLARTLGNQEAGCKQLARLLHNQRLSEKRLAESVCRQALRQVPRHGLVRVTLDWTSEGDQHLLALSLIIGRRAVPIFWRAYDQRVLKGRMKGYELAVVKRAFKRLFQVVAPRRVFLTADRGFPDEDLFALLERLGVKFILRVKNCVKVQSTGRWQKLNTFGFRGNERQRALGWRPYCERSPRRLWITMHRARDKQGHWGTWYLVSNRQLSPAAMAREYARRFGCEEGFRDTKWYLGFKRARVRAIRAWSRLFALFALALLALVTLGTYLLLRDPDSARRLLRRVASRRQGRCELSLVTATLSLLQQDRVWLACLLPFTKFNLETTLANVS